MRRVLVILLAAMVAIAAMPLAAYADATYYIQFTITGPDKNGVTQNASFQTSKYGFDGNSLLSDLGMLLVDDQDSLKNLFATGSLTQLKSKLKAAMNDKTQWPAFHAMLGGDADILAILENMDCTFSDLKLNHVYAITHGDYSFTLVKKSSENYTGSAGLIYVSNNTSDSGTSGGSGSGTSGGSGSSGGTSGGSSGAAEETKPVIVIPDSERIAKVIDTVSNKGYIKGRANGDFCPLDYITRAEVCVILYRLLLDKDVAITRTFSDVPEGYWAATEINTLASLGIIDGYAGGVFKPKDEITRAAFTKMVVSLLSLAGSELLIENAPEFRDVTTSYWAYTYIAKAAELGWIGGYTVGDSREFRPVNRINRAEVCAIINRMIGRTELPSNPKTFPDVAENYWARDYIVMAAGEAEQ
jgi:hypothetical protein